MPLGRRRDAASAPGGLDAPVVFRPTFVRVLCVVVWVSLAYLAVGSALDGPALALRSAPPLLLVAAVAYALFWRPAVRVDGDCVTLLNVLRDVRVPFAALEAVDTRFALTLEVGQRRWTAWAAPAPGRTSSMGLARREAAGVEHLGVDLSEGVRASTAPNTDSGGAALLVQHRWARWRDAAQRQPTAGDGATGDGSQRVTVRWNAPLAVLLAAAALGTVVTFAAG